MIDSHLAVVLSGRQILGVPEDERLDRISVITGKLIHFLAVRQRTHEIGEDDLVLLHAERSSDILRKVNLEGLCCFGNVVLQLGKVGSELLGASQEALGDHIDLIGFGKEVRFEGVEDHGSRISAGYITEVHTEVFR